MVALLAETRGAPAEDIARHIEERTVAFCGGGPGDDVAVLALRVLTDGGSAV
jgi:Stage II sporulation protein E (SpoIIE).